MEHVDGTQLTWIPAPTCSTNHPYGEEGWRPGVWPYHEHAVEVPRETVEVQVAEPTKSTTDHFDENSAVFLVFGDIGAEAPTVRVTRMLASEGHPPAELTDYVSEIRCEWYGDGSVFLRASGYEFFATLAAWRSFATKLAGVSLGPSSSAPDDLASRRSKRHPDDAS